MAVCSICHETFFTSLTPRELQVLALLSQAMSARLIAQELCISDKTVETYYRSMRRKLKLPDRNHLMCYAVRYMMEQEGATSCQKMPA